MIPKPLDQIEWTDLEALIESGREESDTIEFKRSFSGGDDFLALSNTGKERAVKGIAREAIAFLNGRGGDIVIGAVEESNENPRIKSLNPLPNLSQSADSLAQALQALIEPYQTVLGVRAIRKAGANVGILIVRAPESIRAPHRFTRDRECYVRRGRESVAMPMDEIQDLTVRRAASRSERIALLDEQFKSLSDMRVGRNELSAHRVHFRTCFVPLGRVQIQLTDEILAAFGGQDPDLHIGTKTEKNDVAFRGIAGRGYQAILRGMAKEDLTERVWSESDFVYASKTIREDGIMTTDFSCRSELSESKITTPGFHNSWISGYFANTLASIAGVQGISPVLTQGILRVAVHAAGPILIGDGEGMWPEHKIWPPGTVVIPDFEIEGPNSVLESFRQLQVDVAAIAGLKHPRIYNLAPLS